MKRPGRSATWRRFPPAIGSRIVEALERAAEAPRRSFERLRSVPESKLRIGDHRAIMALDAARRTLVVVRIRHRRSIYP